MFSSLQEEDDSNEAKQERDNGKELMIIEQNNDLEEVLSDGTGTKEKSIQGNEI